jgi:hypothetical protein
MGGSYEEKSNDIIADIQKKYTDLKDTITKHINDISSSQDLEKFLRENNITKIFSIPVIDNKPHIDLLNFTINTKRDQLKRGSQGGGKRRMNKKPSQKASKKMSKRKRVSKRK